MAITALQIDFLKAGILLHGKPLSRGWVTSYLAGTSTLSALYSAADKGSSHTNPVQLDDDGKVLAFGDGAYKFLIQDENLVTIETIDNMSYSIVPGDVWKASNDGAGSGLDADKVDAAHAGNASGNVALSNTTKCVDLNADLLDGRHDTAFARKDEAATQTFSGALRTPNNTGLIVSDNSGNARTIANINASNGAEVGNVNNPLNLITNGTLQHNGTAITSEREVKAKAHISAAGVVTGAYNVASASWALNVCTVTFTSALSDANYPAIATITEQSESDDYYAKCRNRLTTSVDVVTQDPDGNTSPMPFSIACL